MSHKIMENEFTKVMSKRTDQELIKIVTVEREGYNPLAIEAAEYEIETREINTEDFESIKEQAVVEKEQKQFVDSNVVGLGIRFVNFLIDITVWLFLTFVISFIVGLFIQSTNETVIMLIGCVLILGTFIGYYSIMEIKFQKTLGKFVTKTKVVNLNGDKPENGEIIKRSFYRLIPCDRLSFFFVKNGFHDYLSKTKVVKDIVE